MVKRMKKKDTRRLLILLVVLLVLSYGFSVISDYRGKIGGETVQVTIEAGSGTASIAALLRDNDIIDKPFWFRVFSKLGGHDGEYQQGTYVLQKNAGYKALFEALKHSNNLADQVKVTIPEGYELRQIADTLEEAGLIDRERFYDLVENATFDYWFLKDVPKRENRLEGYLFPDTYMFSKADGEEGILRTMLSRFDEVYTEKFRARAKELSMSDDEIITLASVIEREAQGDVDRKLVAGVFHNRLQDDEYPFLESCATVQYILKDRKAVLSIADTKIQSPYNTYINPGLPKGPIASPGLLSIEAALYPEKTNYMFFVMGSDGKHHFAVTHEEHLANMKK